MKINDIKNSIIKVIKNQTINSPLINYHWKIYMTDKSTKFHIILLENDKAKKTTASNANFDGTVIIFLR